MEGSTEARLYDPARVMRYLPLSRFISVTFWLKLSAPDGQMLLDLPSELLLPLPGSQRSCLSPCSPVPSLPPLSGSPLAKPLPAVSCWTVRLFYMPVFVDKEGCHHQTSSSLGAQATPLPDNLPRAAVGCTLAAPVEGPQAGPLAGAGHGEKYKDSHGVGAQGATDEVRVLASSQPHKAEC